MQSNELESKKTTNIWTPEAFAHRFLGDCAPHFHALREHPILLLVEGSEEEG